MLNKLISDLVIYNIEFVSTMYTKKEVVGERHDRERWAVIVKYEGETVYTAHGRSLRSNINNIAVLPAGSDYRWECVKSGHYAVLEFDANIRHDDIFVCPVKDGERILNILKGMETKRTLLGKDYAPSCFADAYSVLALIKEGDKKTYSPKAKHKKISPALQYIAEHYSEKITNEELAEVSGVSCVYFRKLFREVMGKSPIDYICSMRIAKAKEMLKGDYGSITSVAEALGYLNIYEFSRAFKKHVGISPSEYAAAQ